MMKWLIGFWIGLICLPLAGQYSEPPIGYDFEQPQLVATMPSELDEISGLSFTANGRELLAVQDEKGVVYRLSATDGRLLSVREFWKDGDYEGIEVIGDDIWVVKNTGTLYRIRRTGREDQEVTKFNGHLKEENDVEGLAYDPANHRLLLACKSHIAGSIEVRSIFAFDLNSLTFGARPVFSIGRVALQNYLEQCPKTRKHHKIVAFFNERKQYELGPSAVAIHPQTGKIFVTSSAGKLIVVLSPNGKVEHVRKLDKDFFPQPEGLAFHPDGSLYISTEAKDGAPARIYRLPYQPGFAGF